MLIEGKTPWEFACDWYSVEAVHRGCLQMPVPRDTESREFAEWLTHQYRLAMNRGLELGIEAAKAAKEKRDV